MFSKFFIYIVNQSPSNMSRIQLRTRHHKQLPAPMFQRLGSELHVDLFSRECRSRLLEMLLWNPPLLVGFETAVWDLGVELWIFRADWIPFLTVFLAFLSLIWNSEASLDMPLWHSSRITACHFALTERVEEFPMIHRVPYDPPRCSGSRYCNVLASHVGQKPDSMRLWVWFDTKHYDVLFSAQECKLPNIASVCLSCTYHLCGAFYWRYWWFGTLTCFINGLCFETKTWTWFSAVAFLYSSCNLLCTWPLLMYRVSKCFPSLLVSSSSPLMAVMSSSRSVLISCFLPSGVDWATSESTLTTLPP